MKYSDVINRFYSILDTHKVMAIATSSDNKPKIRNISAIIINQRIFFKTDINFTKTKDLLDNSNVAMAFHGISFEGIAINRGNICLEENKFFIEKYNEYFDKSYNSYIHEDSEILVEVVPQKGEIWDQDEAYNGFQIIVDFNNKTAVKLEYD